MINNNRYLWALTMLGVNVGARAIVGDIGTMHPTLFDGTVAKAVVLFCMFFMASRDVAVALVMVAVFFVAVFGVLNPQFKYSLVPTAYAVERYPGGREPVAARLRAYSARQAMFTRSG